jgi:hypothetical protein
VCQLIPNSTTTVVYYRVVVISDGRIIIISIFFFSCFFFHKVRARNYVFVDTDQSRENEYFVHYYRASEIFWHSDEVLLVEALLITFTKYLHNNNDIGIRAIMWLVKTLYE